MVLQCPLPWNLIISMYKKMIVFFGILVYDLETCSAFEIYSIIYCFGNMCTWYDSPLIYTAGPSFQTLHKPLPRQIVMIRRDSKLGCKSCLLSERPTFKVSVGFSVSSFEAGGVSSMLGPSITLTSEEYLFF